MKDPNCPYVIVFNGRGEMIVGERCGQLVSVFDVRGQRIRIFKSHGDIISIHVGPYYFDAKICKMLLLILFLDNYDE